MNYVEWDGAQRRQRRRQYLVHNATEPKWRIALQFMNGMRRWIFLPCLVVCIPTAIVLQGGDALSVCFNVSVMPCVNVWAACAAAAERPDL
jgi:hypothetical protein